MKMRYGFGETPFGPALLVTTLRGICHLSFVEPQHQKLALAALRQAWPEAHLEEDVTGSRTRLAEIFSPEAPADGSLSLWVSGTNFQIQVWRALLEVPFAGLLSYQQLAGLLGRPSAARAVGSAVARNRIAFLIPCHRILRGSGEFGVYHWGTVRKAAICGWEAAAVDRATGV
jgi:AraC family transcriptional regulator of adaptative response/methylated-DNA-[protein]-cysteine methyltransferase